MKAPLFTVYDWSWILPSIFLLILYTVMIWHIRNGNKNTWLVMMCVLLMVNNAGGIFVGFGLYELTVLKNIERLYVWCMGIGVSLDYSAFCVAHYLLAVKYSRMAKNVPELLAGRPEI
jgi:hypothetical protein